MLASFIAVIMGVCGEGKLGVDNLRGWEREYLLRAWIKDFQG